jgi:hypothetical protein
MPSLEECIQEIQHHCQEAQEAIKVTQQRLMKETAFKPFKVGDCVWLEKTNLPLPYKSSKLAPKWYRPFSVTKKISNVSYKLKLLPTWKVHDTFHVGLLMPYKESEKYGLNFLEPPPELLNGKPEWEVEEIMRQRQYWNKQQYLWYKVLKIVTCVGAGILHAWPSSWKFGRKVRKKHHFWGFWIFGCLFQFLDSEFRISQGNVANYD